MWIMQCSRRIDIQVLASFIEYIYIYSFCHRNGQNHVYEKRFMLFGKNETPVDMPPYFLYSIRWCSLPSIITSGDFSVLINVHFIEADIEAIMLSTDI